MAEKRTQKAKIIRIQVRLPRDVHKNMTDAAKLEHLSLNSLIIRSGGEAARKLIQKHKQQSLFEEKT
jgi:uncharacterized protein (DUF1778 family)